MSFLEKDLAFIVDKVRHIDPNKMIVDKVFSNPLTGDYPNHLTVIAMNYSNCFRSATLVSNLTEKIEEKKQGLIYADLNSIHYGTHGNFTRKDVVPEFFDEDILSFIKSNHETYPTLVVNLMDCDESDMKYSVNWLNQLCVVNRTMQLDIFVLITKSRLSQYRHSFIKILQNTDNLIYIDDFSLVETYRKG
jgi:hypothetical protein